MRQKTLRILQKKNKNNKESFNEQINSKDNFVIKHIFGNSQRFADYCPLSGRNRILAVDNNSGTCGDYVFNKGKFA